MTILVDHAASCITLLQSDGTFARPTGSYPAFKQPLDECGLCGL
jgi:hypothetical protein